MARIASSSITTTVSVAVVMTCFAANSVITRYLIGGDYVLPLPLTIIRFVSGLAMLGVISISKPALFQGSRVSKRYVVGALLLGAYAFAISFGYSFITAAAGALVFYSFVVLTMSSYSVLKDGEAPTLRLALGQALGIVGVLVITFGRIGAVTPQGVLLMAATGISWGLYNVYARTFDNPFGYTFNTFLVLGVICLILVPATYPLIGGGWAAISPYALLLALYMGAISTALSYVLWNWTLRRLSASQGGISQLVVPILTSVMGVLLLSESVDSLLLVGGLLILAGIYISSNRKSRFKDQTAPPSVTS